MAFVQKQKVIDALKNGGQLIYDRIYHIYTVKNESETFKIDSHRFLSIRPDLVRVDSDAMCEYYRLTA